MPWVLAVAVLVAVVAQASAQQTPRSKSDDKSWQAVAPGLVEPRSGEIKMMAPVLGRTSDVLASSSDRVIAGQLLVRLDEEEARARVASALDQVALRKRARNDQAAGKNADRRRAEDAAADAEAAVVEAREAFDRAAIAKRGGSSGSDADLATARTAWTNAEKALAQQQARLHKLAGEAGTPLPTQSEGQLNVARAELRLAYAGLEKLAIRAPVAGTVLQVNAKVGEIAGPSAPQPLVVLGDLSALRVRAELDERDIGKTRLGNKVIVRADAFRGREFAGKVSSIALTVQAGHISSPGSRNLTDFSVAEVLIDLSDPGPLIVGMKVDVYFQPDSATQ